MPAYNAEHFIPQAISRVLSQKGLEFELVVADTRAVAHLAGTRESADTQQELRLTQAGISRGAVPQFAKATQNVYGTCN